MSTDPLETVPVDDFNAPSDRLEAAPPTVQGQIVAPQRKPAWPTVLGVIAVVFGAVGILAYTWGIASVLLMGDFFEAMTPGVPGGPAPVMPKSFVPLNVAMSALSLIPAFLLLPAGVGLLKRRRWGVRLTRIWAVIKMPIVVGVAVLTYMMQQAMFSTMSRQNTGGTPFGPMEGTFLAVMVLFSLAWGWALPVFMLIFLSRRKVKEHVENWP